MSNSVEMTSVSLLTCTDAGKDEQNDTHAEHFTLI